MNKTIPFTAIAVLAFVGTAIAQNEAAEDAKSRELMAESRTQLMLAHYDEALIKANVEWMQKLLMDKQLRLAKARQDGLAAMIHSKKANTDDLRATMLWAQGTQQEQKAMAELRQAQAEQNYARAEIRSRQSEQVAIAEFTKSLAQEKDAKVRATKEGTLAEMEKEANEDLARWQSAEKAGQQRTEQAEAAIKIAAELKQQARKLDPKIAQEEAGETARPGK